MNIIILEDDCIFKSKLETIIERFIDTEFKTFYVYLSSGTLKPVYEYINTNSEVSLYFLDIVINNDAVGIELLNMIKNKNSENIVIIITSHPEYILYSSKDKLISFNTILKTSKNLKEELYDTLDFINKSMKLNNDKVLIIENRYSGILRIHFDDIFLIETTKKSNNILIHYSSSTDYVRFSISSILKELDSRFIKCHRSYIVNTTKIQKVSLKDKKIILNNGLVAYYSNTYKKSITSLWK